MLLNPQESIYVVFSLLTNIAISISVLQINCFNSLEQRCPAPVLKVRSPDSFTCINYTVSVSIFSKDLLMNNYLILGLELLHAGYRP